MAISARRRWRHVAIAAFATAVLLVPSVVHAADPDDKIPSRGALDACPFGSEPDPADDPASAAQRSNPVNRVTKKDVAGRDLAGRDFRGKVLLDLKLKGANLRGADLTGAVICGTDLRDADLTGARLDRVRIGGDSELHGADFTNASGRELDIADAGGSVRIDGADLQGARLFCDPFEFPRCLRGSIGFSSMARADLRGATVGELCCDAKGIESARLDGVTTLLSGLAEIDFARLAAGAGPAGRMTFTPAYGFSGRRTTFTGAELRELAAVMPRMRAAAIQPSFDCARAATRVEKVVCTEPKLAALDRALAWAWQRVERSAERQAAQRAWLARRAQCPARDPDAHDTFSPHDFAVPADRQGCIGIAYAERIRALAPLLSDAAPEPGTYTSDAPRALPRGPSAALAEKFYAARGLRQDAITVRAPAAGAGPLSGSGVWANGHICGFDAADTDTTRTGVRFRVGDAPGATDEDSISFVVTPQVVLRAGGNRQFQCGARGSWSAVYFRQPDELVAKANTAP